MKKSIIKRMAFTLAEVLIVLGIIGIVAQMTIPTLMRSVQEQVYVTSLKKVYTTWNQVLMQLAADNGCIGDLKCTGLFETGTTTDALGQALVKYFKVIKDCGITGGGGCLPAKVNDSYDGLGAVSLTWDTSSRYGFITADGMAYSISNYANGCAAIGTGTGNMAQACAHLRLDVNGPDKGPNFKGRDIFVFFIANGKGPLLYPDGGKESTWWRNSDAPGDYKYCFPGNKVSSNTCTGRVMEEGWVMNY